MGRHWYTAARYAARRRASRRRGTGVRARSRCHRRAFPARPTDDHAATLAVRRIAAVHVPARLPVFAPPGHGRRATWRTTSPAPVADARPRELRAVGERRAAAHAAVACRRRVRRDRDAAATGAKGSRRTIFTVVRRARRATRHPNSAHASSATAHDCSAFRSRP